MLTSFPVHRRSDAGFSLIELLVVMAVLGILGAIAVPQVGATASGIKLRDHAGAISNLIGLAKMRATSKFSRTRVYADTKAGTYAIQVYDSKNATWSIEGGTTTLPPGLKFGWGSITAPPPNTQDGGIGVRACRDKDNVEISDTACIVFNSRGIPIDTATNSPQGGNAFYITDGTGVRGVTVTATPLIRNWWSTASGAHWIRE